MSRIESWFETRFERKVTRNADKVNAKLRQLQSGDKIKLVTAEPAFIYVPYRFVTAGLAYVEDVVKIIAQFAIVVGDHYAVSNVPALCEIKPESRKRVKIDDVEYLEFNFDKNSVVIEDLHLFQDSAMIFNIFNEEIAKGNVPFYFNDEDFTMSLDLAADFANLKLGKNNVSLEMIISSITRNGKNLSEYYRTNPDGNYKFIPLRNIQLGATNTLSKVNGSYYELGITSALSRDSDKLEDIERLLRI